MKAAHRIKGSASYLCCEELKDRALKLQDAGHAGTTQPEKGAELMANIEVLFAEFQEALKKLVAAIHESRASDAGKAAEEA